MPVKYSRRFLKNVYFLGRGLGFRKSCFLARHDAPIANDYRKVALPSLKLAWASTHSWSDLLVRNTEICSRSCGVSFQTSDLFSNDYDTFFSMTKIGWSVERNGDQLIVKRGMLTLSITTAEEVNMLREIHIQGCYRLHFTGQWNVCDVGANAGIAATAFAEEPWVRKVIAFEPFEETAEILKKNLGLNPHLAKKIRVEVFGLGDEERKLQVEYVASLRGSMGIYGLGNWSGAQGKVTSNANIFIRRAGNVMRSITSELAGYPTLLKLDCEGSEYPILRDLERESCLTLFSAIIIEWHRDGPGEIVSILSRNGFQMHVRPLSTDQHTLGLIYAWRNIAI